MADDSIGALWLKEGKKGEYFTGNVVIDGEKHSIVIFKNDYKKEDKHPDYKIYRQKERE